MGQRARTDAPDTSAFVVLNCHTNCDREETKEMATHSSILAWRIPWTEEPGGLQSMGLKRVGHEKGNIEMNKEKRLNRGPAMMIVMGRVLFDENMSQTLRSNPEHRQSLPSERSQYR
ncbi:hypothetical protein CapIbe_017983 [Capra ibex]